MNILITNDDGYNAGGIKALIRALKPYGELTIVAPKSAQSGMSMAVTMGHKPIAVKHMYTLPGEDWWYLDGTPASCIKYGIDNVLFPRRPDVVVSGINHGANAATASIYSGTIGAAMEGAVNGIPAIGVSLDSFDPDADFSVVEKLFPPIFEKLTANMSKRFGCFYNVNFPNIPADEVKGVKVTTMGMAHWEREYRDYEEFMNERGLVPPAEHMEYVRNAEPDEHIYVMAGDFTSNEGNPASADHLLLEQGWITITPENIDNTDYEDYRRLCDII